MGKPPYSTRVPTPVAVWNAGIPEPPERIFSARVPYGVSSTSSSPSKYIFSNKSFSPTYDATILLICLLCKSLPKPQSVTPALLETTVKFLTPSSYTAYIRFSGIPQRPKPPTSILSPSLMPFIASAGDLHTLSKLKNIL